MRRTGIALLSLVCMVCHAYGQENPIRNLRQLLMIMESSKVLYEIHPLAELPEITRKDCVDALFPALVPHQEYPWVESTDGEYTLTSFPMDSLAFRYLVEGEPAYRQEKYEEARSFYLKALERDNRLYVAYLHIGDTYLFSDDPETAITYYRRAGALNPYDYRCFYYLGNAYVKAGKKEEALDAYRTALSLKPRHENLLNTIRAYRDFLDVAVYDTAFEPFVLIRKTDEKKVEIYVSVEEEEGIWMPYAFAKAIWIGEEGGREDARNWSSRAETEAIAVLLEGYLTGSENGKIAPIPWLDRMMAMVKAGYLTEFILYEIAARMNPDITLTLGPEIRHRVKDFITRYVVVDIH